MLRSACPERVFDAYRALRSEHCRGASDSVRPAGIRSDLDLLVMTNLFDIAVIELGLVYWEFLFMS
jgi:hypothetical protein